MLDARAQGTGFSRRAQFDPVVLAPAFEGVEVVVPVRVTDRGPRNVLIVQNTRDPATPLVTALGLRRALGSRAVMVTVDQGGHDVLKDDPVRDAGARAAERVRRGDRRPLGQQDGELLPDRSEQR